MTMGNKFFQWFQKNDNHKDNPITEMEQYILEVEEQIASIQGKMQLQLVEEKHLKDVLNEYRVEIQKLEKYENIAKEREDLQGIMLYQSKREELIELESQKSKEYEKIKMEIEENQSSIEQIYQNIEQLKIAKDTLENTMLNE